MIGAMQEIREAVAKATEYLSDHPDEARYRDSHARAQLGAGLRVVVTGPSGERLETDMPRGIGGGAAMPSPGWYYRAAAASCVASLIGIRAAALGVDLPVNAVEVTVDTESDDRGILGVVEGTPAGALSMRVVVSLTAGRIERPAFEAIARWAVDHCPVTDTTRRPVPVDVIVA
jgi:uncharacterized OsmC-like protein